MIDTLGVDKAKNDLQSSRASQDASGRSESAQRVGC